MQVGDYVVINRGVHKGRRGIINEILFGEYFVQFYTKERYWFDRDEITILKLQSNL